MSGLADALYAVTVNFWVGSLWAIGFISAPVLFSYMADASLAGSLAGRQFAIVAWLGMGCACYQILYLFFKDGAGAFKQAALWLVVLMLLLVLAGHFGVTPIVEQLRADPAREVVQSVVRSRFQAWHGIASLLWVIQSILGVALVLQVSRR
jgi:hypothetical protein